jgi:negative regulator of sigma-B (phosphoserine phosphatase)
VEAVSKSLIEWGAAAMALEGQTACGDGFVVKPFRAGVLVAVVDGLGHGSAAAAAAALAIRTLETHAEESVVSLVNRCHERLRGTRGAVISLASFNARDNTVTWLGVGNVEGLLVRRSDDRADCESLVLRGGVLGAQLPALRVSLIPVSRGDILILASDGIGAGFARAVAPAEAPQAVADRILAEHGKTTDDALVLVSRYVGEERVSR